MVRAPRSAHIAVAPAPATTKHGHDWADLRDGGEGRGVPLKSAAPNSSNKMLKVNTTSTVYGTASIRVGSSDTRATNQA